jgi:hypothetical protein
LTREAEGRQSRATRDQRLGSEASIRYGGDVPSAARGTGEEGERERERERKGSSVSGAPVYPTRAPLDIPNDWDIAV